MTRTIRGRIQIVLLLAWALVVILIGLLSSAGGMGNRDVPSPGDSAHRGREGPPPAALGNDMLPD